MIYYIELYNLACLYDCININKYPQSSSYQANDIIQYFCIEQRLEQRRFTVLAC